MYTDEEEGEKTDGVEVMVAVVVVLVVLARGGAEAGSKLGLFVVLGSVSGVSDGSDVEDEDDEALTGVGAFVGDGFVISFIEETAAVAEAAAAATAFIVYN